MSRLFCLAGLPMFELHGFELGTGRPGEYLWKLASSAKACLVSIHGGSQCFAHVWIFGLFILFL